MKRQGGGTGKGLVVRQMGQDTVVYDPVRDEVHVLNATAQFVLELSREGKGVGEIEAAFRERFQVPAGHDLRAEIETCLADLREKHLL